MTTGGKRIGDVSKVRTGPEQTRQVCELGAWREQAGANHKLLHIKPYRLPPLTPYSRGLSRKVRPPRVPRLSQQIQTLNGFSPKPPLKPSVRGVLSPLHLLPVDLLTSRTPLLIIP